MEINRDIQAVHRMMHLFVEQAKAKSEEILDTVPGVLCIIDDKGVLYRANRTLAELMEAEHELLLGQAFSGVFSEANWAVFQENINWLFSQKPDGSLQGASLEFELTIDALVPKRNFVWNIQPFVPEYRKDIKLVTVIGRDVTTLKEVTAQKARMEAELITAKTVQDTLFPEAKANLGAIKIAGHYESATECGGDWWYYTKIKDRVFLCIGDVMGHGVSAALVTSSVRAFFSVTELLEKKSPGEILELLNQVVCDVTKFKKHMTIFVGCLDLKTMNLTYANGGHHPVFLLGGRQTTITKNDFQHLSTGPSQPLGQDPVAIYTEETVKLASGDRLFFYTDGIFDVKSRQDVSLGSRNTYKMLIDALTRYSEPSQSLGWLLNSINAYRQGSELLDDLTFFFAQVIL